MTPPQGFLPRSALAASPHRDGWGVTGHLAAHSTEPRGSVTGERISSHGAGLRIVPLLHPLRPWPTTGVGACPTELGVRDYRTPGEEGPIITPDVFPGRRSTEVPDCGAGKHRTSGQQSTELRGRCLPNSGTVFTELRGRFRAVLPNLRGENFPQVLGPYRVFQS